MRIKCDTRFDRRLRNRAGRVWDRGSNDARRPNEMVASPFIAAPYLRPLCRFERAQAQARGHSSRRAPLPVTSCCCCTTRPTISSVCPVWSSLADSFVTQSTHSPFGALHCFILIALLHYSRLDSPVRFVDWGDAAPYLKHRHEHSTAPDLDCVPFAAHVAATSDWRHLHGEASGLSIVTRSDGATAKRLFTASAFGPETLPRGMRRQ